MISSFFMCFIIGEEDFKMELVVLSSCLYMSVTFLFLSKISDNSMNYILNFRHYIGSTFSTHDYFFKILLKKLLFNKEFFFLLAGVFIILFNNTELIIKFGLILIYIFSMIYTVFILSYAYYELISIHNIKVNQYYYILVALVIFYLGFLQKTLLPMYLYPPTSFWALIPIDGNYNYYFVFYTVFIVALSLIIINRRLKKYAIL